ncbi:MAG TPA: FAD-binding oxidoreductase [Pseudobdellovibrionaceae bacterium]|nr:FAD-binding oxidoreductase [Pseudobdellovibrionaceae bacterium]
MTMASSHAQNFKVSTSQLAELQSLLSADRVLTDAASLAHYGRDWTKHYEIQPSCIVFPLNTEEVASLVKWARKNRVGLVPSGGRTGLSGGACALQGEIVVSFEKMNRILNFDPVDRCVDVQAGVITEQLQQFAREQGYLYPVDFAARGSSQIGGNIATNAGGVKVIRYGNTREWISGLTVVTGTGEILHLNLGLVKNATGLDFRHLFIGSEGILGFITEAKVRLTSPPAGSIVMLFAVPDLDSIMKIYQHFRDRLPLTAFEYFSDLALKHVVTHAHLQKPFATDSPHYVLIEVERTDEETEARALECFEHGLGESWILDGAMAQSEAQARDFWRLREDISEATAPHTPFKNDVSVRIAQVPEFLTRTDAALKKHYPDFEVVWFGHIGDGNMHINILKPASLARDEFLARCRGVNPVIFAIIQELGGSVSAEHGVGLVKKPDLSFTRSASEIQLMKQIKSVFDPDGIMNPGKVLD